jgi:hypothetical protein
MMKLNPLVVLMLATWFVACDPSATPASGEEAMTIPGTSSSVSGLVSLTEKAVQAGDAMYLSVADAEKILGEKAKLSDSSSVRSKNVLRIHITYSAIEKAEKERNLYVVFEEFDDTDAAAKRYAFVRDGNADHEGVEPLTGVGDEAYFHSDGTAFCFIMARKGNKVLTMKANRMSAKTSVIAFREIGARVVGEM